MIDSAQPITDESNDFELLFKGIYTKPDLVHFYNQLDQTRSSLFTTTGSFDQQLGTVFSIEKKDALIAFLSAQKVDLNNPVAIQECFSKIKKYGNTLPIVAITTSREPSETILKHMSNWFYETFNRKVLLDVTIQREALAGAFISYNGIYCDGTLRHKVDEYFENKHLFSRKENSQLT